MIFGACLQKVRALAVVAVVVTLPWRHNVWDAPTHVVLAPRSTAAAHAATPTGMRVERAALERQTAPHRGASATTPPARVEVPVTVGDIVRLELDQDAHADPAPSVDEAIAQLLAWVAADQMQRRHDQSDDNAVQASALVASAGTRR